MGAPVPRIRLLGGFSVASGGSPIDDRAWRLRKAKALVKLLALAPALVELHGALCVEIAEL